MPELKTIAIERDTKAALDALKVYPRETYDDVLRRLLGLDGEKGQERSEAVNRRAG